MKLCASVTFCTIVIVFIVGTGLAADPIGFSNQSPTGADRAPFRGDAISCESWVDSTGESYLICLQLNVYFDSVTSPNETAITYYNYRLNRWTDSHLIQALQPSMATNYMTGIALVSDTLYIIQRNVCNQILTFNLVAKTYSKITLTSNLTSEYCVPSNIGFYGYSGALYLFAGDLGSACSGNILRITLSGSVGTLTQLTTLNPNNVVYAVCAPQIILNKEVLYVYGGYVYNVTTSDKILSSNFSALDLATNTWSALPSGPTTMIDGSIVYDAPTSDRFLISGGFADLFGNEPIFRIYAYPLSGSGANTWEDLTYNNGEVFNQIIDAASFFFGGEAYIGGYQIGLYRNPSALFSLGTYYPGSFKRAALADRTRVRNYGDNSTGDAFQLGQTSLLFSQRTGAPYYSLPQGGSVLYMNGRNSRSQLLPNADASHGLDIHVATFIECDANGEALTGPNAAEVTFPLINYYIIDAYDNGAGIQSYNFTANLTIHGENISVTLIMTFYEQGTTVTSAGVSFYEEPNTVKATIIVDSWPFAATTNTLQLKINLSASQAKDQSSTLDLLTRELKTDDPGLQVYDYTYKGLTSSVRLLKFAELDSSNTPVQLSFEDEYVSILFPYYTTSLVYDPDFGATLNTQGGGGGDGSGGQYAYLAFLSVLALVPIVVIIFVVIAVAFFVIKHYLRSGGEDAFNVDEV